MDIHILCHGLGNQLSQYAFFLHRRALGQRAHAYYAFPEHNGYELNSMFGLKEGLPWYLKFVPFAFRMGMSRRFYSERTAAFILSLLRIRIVVEPETYAFDPTLLRPWLGIRILFGGWHDPRYFEGSELIVRKAFAFPVLDARNAEIVSRIDGSDSVSIHVRRGDYTKDKNHGLFGGISTKNYYRNAIAWKVASDAHKASERRFFVFSDDIAWCKDNLDIPNAEFVDVNKGRDSWKDLVLMARCKTNIIANSTFSWWAAWLNDNPTKIVACPTSFVNAGSTGSSIYPSTWHRIAG